MAKIFPGRMQNNLDEHEERENVEKQNLFSDGEILIRKICREMCWCNLETCEILNFISISRINLVQTLSITDLLYIEVYFKYEKL